jgi:hypothetical protein
MSKNTPKFPGVFGDFRAKINCHIVEKHVEKSPENPPRTLFAQIVHTFFPRNFRGSFWALLT